LYIEVKPKVHTAPIITSIKQQLQAGRQPGNFLLGSKSQPTLLELHQALPDIKTVVIEPWSGLRATYRARQVDTRLLSMNQLWLWHGFIGPMAKRGWKLHAYTLNNPKKAKRWAGYGLYGVITDYPDRFE
jgi:glycerophosphoryl diester phosphodiesterase